MIQEQKPLPVQQKQKEPQQRPVSEIMRKLLQQNPNNIDIKRQIKEFSEIIQKRTFVGITENQEQYLQTYGLSSHQQEHFNYINHLLHTRTNSFLDKISQNLIDVKSNLPPPPPPPPKVSQQILDQVEGIMNNLDLPLSLFKRHDNYWSQDNEKTIQTKQYLKDLHEQDRKWKQQLKRKRQDILNEKNQLYHKNIEETNKQERKIKQEEKTKMIKKIQLIKSQAGSRKKTIEESLEFMKKQGRPLYKKMEEDFYNKVELPTLEEKKRKLTEVRQLRRSVDLVEIQQHRQKYQKIKQEHEGVKIINEPVKISFKGKFYQTLEKSNVQELQESRAKSLLQKRFQYSENIKQNYMPTVSQAKSNQVAQRIAQMKKRFKRPKRKLKKNVTQDDQQEEQEEEQPEPQPQPQQEEDDQDQDDDQQKIKSPKDDQYEPTSDERYKMGLKFLQQAKRKRRYKHQSKGIDQSSVKEPNNNTSSIKDVRQVKQSQILQMNQVVPMSNESTRKIKYRNYLHEMSKTNKTIDFIDTSRLKNDLTYDNKVKNTTNVEQLQNKIRNIQEKAKQQQQLLKHKKLKRNQKISKKLQLDNAIVDTIKARLAMLSN